MTIRRLVAATAIFLIVSLPGIPGAQATAYRYWTYWDGSGSTWVYSSVGPASTVPQDGTVQGWRFAVTQGVRGQGEQPRIGVAEAFGQFCAASPAPSGMKRVAVVFDFGVVADAPEGQTPPAAQGTCVIAPQAATGARILSQAATIRTDRGLVCAIGGYPAGECAPAISAPSPSPRHQEPAGTGRSDASPSAPKTTAPDTGSAGANPSGGADSPVRSPDPAGDGGGGPAEDGDGNTGSGGASADTDTDGARGKTRGSGEGRAVTVPADTAPTTPSSAAGQEAATGAAASQPTTDATPAPTFVQTEAATTGPQRSWVPLAATFIAAIGIGVFIWWRRGTA